MPHPLPEDVGTVEGLRYYLVAIPDDSAFSRAALAIYSELESAYKWGREGEIVPDSEDAAQMWAAAVAETVRLIQMGWPDLVISHIDEIESMLGAIRRLTGCCVDEDVSDGDLYTDPVQQGVGDVPQPIIDAGYASGPSDWSGFTTYKCMIAHVVVDDLAGKLRKLGPLVEDAGLVIGGIGAVAAIIASLLTGGGFAIAIGILGSVGAVAGLYSKLSEGGILLDMADDVDAHHDELACAFMEGDGAQGSIDSMYGKIDELFGAPAAAILKNLNSRPVAKALYAGRYDQQDIAATLANNGYVASSYNCDCDGIFSLWNEVEVTAVHSKTPPACDEWIDLGKIGYWVDPGDNWSGDLTVIGNIHIQGTMTEHTNCAGDMDLKVDARIGAVGVVDWPDMTGNPWLPLYDEGSQPSGAVSQVVPFNLSKLGNVDQKVFAIEFRVSTRAGVVDLAGDVSITSVHLDE